MPSPQVVSYANRSDLVLQSAKRIFSTLQDLLAERDQVHVSLTGGTVGIAVLAELSKIPAVAQLDFSRIHFWWSDERFVETGHADRNEQQARNVLLDRFSIPPENIHVIGSADLFSSAEVAAEAYEAELAHFGIPSFDLLLLGMGPDGHIASLFPLRREILQTEGLALAIHDSPKPPPTRVSLTLPAINRAQRIWFLIAGSDKAEAVTRLVSAATLKGTEITEVLEQIPAAGARGSLETLILVAQDALE